MLAGAAAALAAAGFDEPRRRARRLISAVLDLDAGELLSGSERVLTPSQTSRVHASLRRMLAHEPLSRILGKREFWGMEFTLSPDTLDPRPDSETVVEAVLKRLPRRAAPLRVLDLGTGTGCLLLALLSEYQGAFGVGIDASAGAAITARQNAEVLGLADRARFFVGNWAAAISGRFDVVVTNPPYLAAAELAELPPEVAGYDPRRALDGGADGLSAYRAIAEGLSAVLAPRGLFVAEMGAGQANSVSVMLERAGLAVEGVECDLAGVVRCVVARAWDRGREIGSLGRKLLECPAVPSRVAATQSSGQDR
ncbi:MAG TPA: peptide chain release factor N(5)-glutamine methyltransferase [Stellaceae bacterium]|nr:peptide chain release factor N(5)-glutamine methyltransferase [Stellaceae bacterium]